VADASVLAANRLTARWAATRRGGSTVMSGAGVAPVLALLAAGAQGQVRRELLSAIEVADEGDGVHVVGLEIMDTIDRAGGALGAVAIWALEHVPFSPWWTATIPHTVRRQLTGDTEIDRARVDGWVQRTTDGLMTSLPGFGPAPIVLASVVAVRTSWVEPFDEEPWSIVSGPWASATVPGLVHRGPDVDDVAVWATDDGPVTMFRVVGAEEIDVYLAVGVEEAACGHVMRAAVEAVAAGTVGTPGSALPEGQPAPGVRVGAPAMLSLDGRLTVRTVGFAVDADHDLLASADLFGLRAAASAPGVLFPRMTPLAVPVGQARQTALARFTATGFEAAAVSSVAMLEEAPAQTTARPVEVSFDRPFGFVAVHRPTHQVLFAGWVAEPANVGRG
jgi:serine protease inhibitor